MGLLPAVPIFDPYPFSFLTLVVSLEAIFLSIFVLMSQNRAAWLADRRAHLDLQIDSARRARADGDAAHAARALREGKGRAR